MNRAIALLHANQARETRRHPILARYPGYIDYARVQVRQLAVRSNPAAIGVPEFRNCSQLGELPLKALRKTWKDTMRRAKIPEEPAPNELDMSFILLLWVATQADEKHGDRGPECAVRFIARLLTMDPPLLAVFSNLFNRSYLAGVLGDVRCLAREVQGFPDDEVERLRERMRRGMKRRAGLPLDEKWEARSEELIGILESSGAETEGAVGAWLKNLDAQVLTEELRVALRVGPPASLTHGMR